MEILIILLYVMTILLGFLRDLKQVFRFIEFQYYIIVTIFYFQGNLSIIYKIVVNVNVI